MAKKNEYSDMKEGERVETTFSETTSFNGTLRFDSSLRIEGRFRGKILSKGHLIIGENAKINANIKADSIVIAGEVKGDVEAIDRLEMLPSGKLYGNIKTKKLKMADGVVFEGSCQMLKSLGRGSDSVKGVSAS
ncbi:MAG: polymer-forming cytoskeletal protein [Spirochaetes bacterium]|nr:polymer-forming cytoskeletal protein [Spirochaetota bacterium]